MENVRVHVYICACKISCMLEPATWLRLAVSDADLTLVLWHLLWISYPSTFGDPIVGGCHGDE